MTNPKLTDKQLYSYNKEQKKKEKEKKKDLKNIEKEFFENTKGRAELPSHILEENNIFLTSYKDAIDIWTKTHPQKMPPIRQNALGRLEWINRKARKRLKIT